MSRIVVAVDGSEHSRRTVEWATAEAARWHADLDVVHVWHRDHIARGAVPIAGGAETADEAGRVLRASVDLAAAVPGIEHVTPRLINSLRVSDAVADAGDGADLLVLGSRGHGGHAMLGSVADAVVRRARVPVAVVP